MFIKYIAYFVIGCLTFCEMRPISSISEDIGIITRCNATNPVNKNKLNLVLIERRFQDEITEDFKCFLHCLYYNYEWMDSSGNFRPSAIRSALSESTLGNAEIEYLLNACTKNRNENRCQRAFTFTECFWSENTKLEESMSSLEWQMNRW